MVGTMQSADTEDGDKGREETNVPCVFLRPRSCVRPPWRDLGETTSTVAGRSFVRSFVRL